MTYYKYSFYLDGDEEAYIADLNIPFLAEEVEYDDDDEEFLDEEDIMLKDLVTGNIIKHKIIPRILDRLRYFKCEEVSPIFVAECLKKIQNDPQLLENYINAIKKALKLSEKQYGIDTDIKDQEKEAIEFINEFKSNRGLK